MQAEYKNMIGSKEIPNEIMEIMRNKIITKEKEINYIRTDTKCSTHPHNYILELLVETGLLGFLFFFFFNF